MTTQSLPHDKLERLVDRWMAIQDELNSGVAQAQFVKLSKEFSDLSPVVAKINELKKAEEEFAGIEQLIADAASDKDMVDMAYAERADLQPKIEQLVQELRIALLPKDAADARPAIVEIRPGTGGEEAALFAGDLARMYQRHAEKMGWRWEVLEESATDLGGLKELVALVSGEGVFARLKYESGVHRVQRVPETEAGGRIHTSAATVAVLPEADEVEIDIPASDIRIDTMRSSGAGGQHVNTTDSAVRITHIPSGIVVTSSEKSQHRNKEIAMQVLRSRLYEAERERLHSQRAADRKSQVGSGDRSERIRTYNFPQGRMTDHRINLTLYALGQIMGGDLDPIIDALTAHDQAERLAEMEG